mgnify:CR=1 FL=1
MNLIARFILSLAILAAFVLTGSFLVGGGIVSSFVGLALWMIGVVAALFSFVMTKRR